MKNTAYTGESDEVAIEMNQQQEIDFRLPPPYSVEPTSIPNFEPSSAFGSTVPNSTLNLFNETLNDKERFILAPMGRVGFASRNIVVQLQNAAQQPIMSIMTVPGRSISTGTGNDDSIRVGSVIQMINTSGQVLLTAKENGQSMTISSGDQVLGMVEGNLLCGTTLSARSVMGEVLFQSIGGTEMSPITSVGCFGSSPSEFTLMSNRGVALARIARPMNGTEGCSITLFSSRNIGIRTKALLVFTAYLMYYAFLAETTIGNIGARGLAKRLFMCFCIFFVVVLLLFILIPVIVLTTR
ncbi:uncharacterized protein LOC119072354 [Bradysia coprophila]|uniref:uncharacterized protein LOC119072354 n=1 Tax=Bradysia coprophila TaxID=38358 RepID=UPI00187DAC58|nr:uncharacterized protein LOC119072354 [Bradysia coprophila]